MVMVAAFSPIIAEQLSLSMRSLLRGDGRGFDLILRV